MTFQSFATPHELTKLPTPIIVGHHINFVKQIIPELVYIF
jgi:hypothetical protein